MTENKKAYNKKYYSDHKDHLRAYSKKYHREHRDTLIAKMKEHRDKNIDVARARSREYSGRPENRASKKIYDARPVTKARTFETKFGLTKGSALEWFLQSERWCHLCKELVSGKMHLDHNHDTKEIRGWAHIGCNVAEGLVGKSPNSIQLIRSLLNINNTFNTINDIFSGADRPHVRCP